MQPKLVEGRIITPQFKEKKNSSYRMIGVFAKKSRGLMSRYIIQNSLQDPPDIKGFKADSYRFNKQLSKEDQWVFSHG
ncbi:MAG: peroxide stress protein YaaA [Candidatus Thiodiazotropha sp. (ex Lucinoma aequizonata)]|nr:peroxide stress protein YaaA [Candidatus Thiodiazotropha sp. (ex Lucinoma aequizonata)]MCU7910785.1 peroxide stress protein YaaA [Candidatus Thiodiazotropha sp. (ex Lucinoma aequizonata)]